MQHMRRSPLTEIVGDCSQDEHTITVRRVLEKNLVKVLKLFGMNNILLPCFDFVTQEVFINGDKYVLGLT